MFARYAEVITSSAWGDKVEVVDPQAGLKAMSAETAAATYRTFSLVKQPIPVASIARQNAESAEQLDQLQANSANLALISAAAAIGISAPETLGLSVLAGLGLVGLYEADIAAQEALAQAQSTVESECGTSSGGSF